MPNAPADLLAPAPVLAVALQTHADPGLPPSLELSDADRAKVDAAVRWLNQQVQASGLELAAEVKRYILETFFDGDYDRFADPSRSKPLSFSALCRREDLELGETTLYRLIRIARQVEELPGDLGRRLSIRQHRALLPVADPAQKLELARRAAEQDLSPDALGDAVREVQPTNKTGRPPLPVIVKQQRQIERVLKVYEGVADERELVRGLKLTELQELAESMKSSERRLGQLRGAVERELRKVKKGDG